MSDLLAPVDEAGIVAAIAVARAAREPLSVAGNGTLASMLRPVQAARVLSTRALSGITLYAPKELVLRAKAGTTLAELETVVAQQGQHIIAEPPDLSALLGSAGPPTLGGTVGANLSGPRRVAWGAMRDHVIGVRAVNGAAEVIRSGGRVLKNVTGLDLCKLLSGSHGTLAVLTEITLKVLPAPEAVGTVMLSGLDATRAVATLSAALGSPYGVSAAAFLPEGAAVRVGLTGSATLARIEEFATSVAYRTERLRAELAPFGAATILDDAASRPLWRAIRNAAPLGGTEGAIWRVSVRPAAGPEVARALTVTFDARLFLDWGGGLVWVAGPDTPAAHEAVEAAARRAGGTWTLLRGDAVRGAVDVLPPEPAPLAAITRRVKAALDPDGVLNPGRMYAGI